MENNKNQTKEIERIKIEPTTQIHFDETTPIEEIEKQLHELTRQELLYRMNFEETNPEVIKLIKKILKVKK